MTLADPESGSISAVKTGDRLRLTRAVVATVAAQVMIVMASLTIPVLASLIAPAAGMPAYLVGYYSALIYGAAAATSLATPRLMRRWGGIRLHQGMLAMTGVAMLALVTAVPVMFAVSAVVLGLAYGPMNPASTVLIARYTPAGLRARMFSLKQTAVPAGGALAGFGAPLLASALGWRGAILTIAGLSFGLAALLQPWQSEIDRDSLADARAIDPGFWMPVRICLANAGLRAVAFASFAFGAVQFSFSAVFPTVLVHTGWQVREAGILLSFALLVGVVFRIIWGTVADRIGARPVLGVMGLMMGLAALGAAFVGSGWSGSMVIGLAALFGLSAYCWAGIGIAEAVCQAMPSMIAAATAGMIGMTFLGALAGPALFSTVTALTGSFRPAYVLLSVGSIVSGALFLRRPTERR